MSGEVANTCAWIPVIVLHVGGHKHVCTVWLHNAKQPKHCTHEQHMAANDLHSCVGGGWQLLALQ